MADDKEEKEHKEAGGKKGSRKTTETWTQDITNEKKSGGGKKWPWVLGIIAALFFVPILAQQDYSNLQTGKSAAVVADEKKVCSGVKQHVTLTSAEWKYINRKTAENKWCRVMTNAKPRTVQVGLTGGTSFALEDMAGKDISHAKAMHGRVEFTYSLCPPDSSGILNWDCSPINQTATR